MIGQTLTVRATRMSKGRRRRRKRGKKELLGKKLLGNRQKKMKRREKKKRRRQRDSLRKRGRRKKNWISCINLGGRNMLRNTRDLLASIWERLRLLQKMMHS